MFAGDGVDMREQKGRITLAHHCHHLKAVLSPSLSSKPAPSLAFGH